MSEIIECENCGITHKIKNNTKIANKHCSNCGGFSTFNRI